MNESTKRLYFLWDYDLDEAGLRRILRGDNPVEKGWLITRILEYAKWTDIWRYVTPTDIRQNFEQLRFRRPEDQELWAYALDPARPGASPYNGRLIPTVETHGVKVTHHKWLTPLQAEFLARFFATAAGQAFFLTGGTALSAFYLQHRLSVDLDLFTLDKISLAETSHLIPDLVAELGWQIGRARRTEHIHQYLLEAEGGQQSLPLDLVHDVGPQYGEHRQVEGVIVDSLENIGANKLTAILGRTDPKDFVDLYFILQAGYSFAELLAKAQTKDLGLQPFFLAGALLQVRRFSRLPTTTPPIGLEELQIFMQGLADALLSRMPGGQPPGS